MSRIQGLGWRPEKPGSPLLVGAPLELGQKIPDEAGFPAAEWIRSQLWESCTGFVATYFVWLLTGDHCSAYMPWTFGRQIDFGREFWRINSGITMSAAIRAWRDHGVCLEREWNPNSPGFDRDVIPNAISRVNAQQRNLDCGLIHGSDPEQVCMRLASGHPCGIVVEVDGSFQDAGDAPIGPVSGPSRGFHIVTASRYRTHMGRREIRIVNSWGSSWGQDGGAWLTAERVRQSPQIVYCKGVS